jgi:DNA-binding IclR family transcriptional regulator
MADELSLTAEHGGRVASQLTEPAQLPVSGRLTVARSVLKVLGLLADHPDGFRASDVARSVLEILTLLAENPDGVVAGDVAERVGKSTSTAYYLLASLCEEGLAVRDGARRRYRLRREGVAVVPRVDDLTADDLTPAVDALFLRTRKDCYLGRVGGAVIEIVGSRGRPGMPKIPGLGGARIAEGLHAFAMGKVMLSRLTEAARWSYVRRGLRRYTDATITSPQALSDELDEVRQRGVAIDRAEFHPDFCCVAAPMCDVRDRFVAILGLATTPRAFDAEFDGLIDAVLDAAAISKPLQQCHQILRREGVGAFQESS